MSSSSSSSSSSSAAAAAAAAAASVTRQVRYRASWGWPNYLDVQATGWDEAAFERWVIDGQMHLQANVRLLG
jgi:hypothetical protein